MPRQAITISQKASLRAYHESNPSLDHKALRQWFHQQYDRNISQSSVSEILSSRYQSLDPPMQGSCLHSAKRRRVERWPLVEAALQEWLEEISDQTIITADLLREKARWFFQRIPEYRGLSLPKFSDSWILGFRARHAASLHISEENIHEAGHTPSDRRSRQIRHKLSAYQPQDQYVCAVASLYWKMLPESALTRVPICRLEEKPTRFTALLCTNLDGSHRLAPWYIGRNPNPHAFHSVGDCTLSLGMVWRHNISAKMTRTLFREFLHWFDDHLKDRKVVLLLDTPLAQRFVSSNSQPQDSRSLGLTNITVIWLPISWMDAYNQLRQEVTGIWKTFYRRYWVQYVCNQLSAHQNPLTTMNILKAVSWACRAWHIDVGSRNIRNCSRRSGWLGIFSADQAEEDEEEYKAAKQQLRDTVEMLAQMNFLHKAMEIDTFISPPFESPEGAWIEEEQMQTQTGSVEIPEGDSDEEVV